jgi:monoamine oxidase
VPEPHEIFEAARALEFGQAVRVTLWFDRPFWEDDPRFAGAGFIFSGGPVFPTWWTAQPVSVPVITCWSAGPNADALLGLERSAVIGRALGAIVSVAGRTPARLRKAYFHDWHADPFSRGAYSYAPPGALRTQKADRTGGRHSLLRRGSYRLRRPLRHRAWRDRIGTARGAADPFAMRFAAI